jgi:hypothetical protein
MMVINSDLTFEWMDTELVVLVKVPAMKSERAALPGLLCKGSN